ncbi:MAG: hypothetical protein IJ827_00355 [Lachnospiraceae bacterium]|nr:hypothetical protein [Lachnospiraceae bacterium]MBR1913258.1 hypothetical protein [Lachnospiraceae bacterium]
MTIYEAMTAPFEYADPDKAAGRVAAGSVTAYPPDIPILIAGEPIGQDHIRKIKSVQLKGGRVIGLFENKLKVVKN